MNKDECILFSGGARGAEAAFGANAERLGIEEVNFTFEGHNDARTRGIRVLTDEVGLFCFGQQCELRWQQVIVRLHIEPQRDGRNLGADVERGQAFARADLVELLARQSA